MTTENTLARVDAELAHVLRELVAALHDARPYVVAAVEPAAGGVRVADFAAGHRTLDRLDAALADAGELLAESGS